MLGLVAAHVCSPTHLSALLVAGAAVVSYGVSIELGKVRTAAILAVAAAWGLGWAAGARQEWPVATYKPYEHILEGEIERVQPAQEGRRRLDLHLAGAAIIGKDGRPGRVVAHDSTVRIWLDRELPDGVDAGDFVLVRVRAPRGAATRNFGESDEWASRPHQTAAVAGPVLIRRATAWRRAIAAVRVHVARRAAATHLSRATRGLVLALVLGDRRDLDPGDVRAFRRSGTAHLLAVSGLNVSLVTGALFWGASFLLVRTPLARRVLVARPAAALAVVGCWAYALLTGLEPPVHRAALMSSFALMAVVAGRPSQAARAVVLAAAAMVLGEPALLWQASFQLSFVAVLALIVVGGKRASDGGDGGREPRRFERWLGPVKRLVETSFAASVATAPLVACHFGEVSPWGVAVNVVAVPATTLVAMPASIVTCLAAAASESAGRLVGRLTGPVLDLFLRAVRWTGELPWLAPPIARPDLATAVVLSLSVLLAARRRSRVFGAILLVVAAGAWVIRLEAPRVRGVMQVTFADVGAGNAALVRLPDGRRWLLDTGPRAGSPGWVPDVVSVVQRSGFGRLDVLALTHGHDDHTSGAAAVLDRVGAAQVWAPLAGRGERPLPVVARFRTSGGVVVAPRCGAWELSGGVRLEVVHPCGRGDGLLSENDRSLVVRLSLGSVSLLLPGDIERETEERLVSRVPGLRATVLELPHHGSDTSSSEALLDAVRPVVAVASCARSRSRPLPSPEVAERLRRHGVRLLSTAELGALRLTTDGERLEIESARVGRVEIHTGEELF
jgi:competence protein ComEC